MARTFGGDGPSRERGRGDSTAWQEDERGRMYRVAKGGHSREYQNAQDRDEAVEESYRVSQVMQAILGDTRDGVLAAVMGNVVSIAELYHQETGQWFGDAREFLTRWCEQHFGRRLEPVARMVLAYEIKRRRIPAEGGHNGPPAGPYPDWTAERKFEAAAADAPQDLPGIERVKWIARRAGARIGKGGARSMPPADVDVEREANRQRRRAAEQELDQEQAAMAAEEV